MGQRNGRAQGLRPKGYPGMREVGNISLPTKLLEKGVKDMVRINGAPMPQADKGRDLDFLVGSSGSVVTRESH